MADRVTFDPADPFDAIAQATKTAVAASFVKAFDDAQSVKINSQKRVEALMAGLIVGACGCAMALVDPAYHGELRSMLIAAIPGCFDDAREMHGLPPLGRPS